MMTSQTPFSCCHAYLNSSVSVTLSVVLLSYQPATSFTSDPDRWCLLLSASLFISLSFLNLQRFHLSRV
ncbi:hypothetical protein EDD85DRAFT_852427 [Armillaria nabsnona]|nr:hypothetical protein EDD85DRAFT_852427 [Armillaria nabsnona]